MAIKVTMTKTQQGSPDHIRVETYKEGQEYDLPDFLAKTFVEEVKCAEYVTGRRREVDHTAPPAVDSRKMAKAALENKDAASVDEEIKEAPVAVPAKPATRARA